MFGHQTAHWSTKAFTGAQKHFLTLKELKFFRFSAASGQWALTEAKLS